MSIPVSILILTLDEDQNLADCLASVSWSDDIHVLDSYSTDKTIDIAGQAGAHVTQRKFDNWASHQNWAIANIPFKHPWVLYIDADERVTAELRDAVSQAVEKPDDNIAFKVQRRDFYRNRWLRHVQASPYYIRLFQPTHLRYERLVNPVSIPDGPVGSLTGYLDHFPFSKGIGQWIEKHNSYSTFEARQIMINRSTGEKFSFAGALFAKSFHERRFHQKELFYRLPGRPLVKFILLYFFKRGFLDGSAGFTYAILQAIYEYFIELKTRELTSSQQDKKMKETVGQ